MYLSSKVEDYPISRTRIPYSSLRNMRLGIGFYA